MICCVKGSGAIGLVIGRWVWTGEYGRVDVTGAVVGTENWMNVVL